MIAGDSGARSDSKAKDTVDAILDKARELALKAVGDKIASGDGDDELQEKHKRMQERLELERQRKQEAERKDRLSRMLSQAEEAKRAAAAADEVVSSDSEDEDTEPMPSFQSLLLPQGTGGLREESSMDTARQIVLQRHSLDLSAREGPTAVSKEVLEDRILQMSQKVRKYETKVRRGVGDGGIG